MLRKFILKDTETGEELILPVTPSGYEVEHGRKINSLIMQTVGEITLPGNLVLLDEELECLLPAHSYPFNQPGTNTNPFVYLERLQKWSDAGRVLRFIVSDTPVNAAVLLGPIRYREQDGTNDLYCTVPIRGYRQLAAVTVQSAQAGTVSRTVETPPAKPDTHTVQYGDTLSAICRKVYGDASLADRLAAANGIKNPNVIHVGQVLQLPDKAQLPAAAKPSRSQAAAESTVYGRDPATGKSYLNLPRSKVLEIM